MPSSILSVRLSDAERSLLEAAAGHAHTKLSEFIRLKALEAAEEELMERRVIEIPAEKWAEVEALVNSPAKEIPAVKELFQHAPKWKP